MECYYHPVGPRDPEYFLYNLGEEYISVVGFSGCEVDLAPYLVAPSCPGEMGIGAILSGTSWVWS